MGTQVVTSITTSNGLVQSGTSLTASANGHVLVRDAGALTFRGLTSADVSGGIGGAGTVTSVGLSVPSFLSVAGSPITTAGTLAVTLANQGQSTVLAGPVSGAAAPPTFRQLEAGDFSNKSANTVAAGPASGGAAVPTFRALVAADVGLTTKGDLLTYSTVLARLAVGTTGQVLTADSAEATGLKWATPSAGGGSLDIDGLTLTDAAVDDTLPIYDVTVTANRKLTIERLGGFIDQGICEGRLTLTSGTPVTTSDVLAATTLYFTPYGGARVVLWDGTRWVLRTLTELTLSLSGWTANTNYDIFLFDSGGGSLGIVQGTAWSNSGAGTSTRDASDLLTVRDGIYLRNANETRRYLGTIRTTGTTGQTEDSDTKRFVWNYYNRRVRRLHLTTSGIHTYTSGTVRPWNNTTANRVEYVAGYAEDVIPVHFAATSTPLVDGQAATTGVGLDSTTNFGDGGFAKVDPTKSAGKTCRVGISTVQAPSLGYHYLQALESSHTTSPYSEFNNFSLFAEVWA